MSDFSKSFEFNEWLCGSETGEFGVFHEAVRLGDSGDVELRIDMVEGALVLSGDKIDGFSVLVPEKVVSWLLKSPT